MLNTMLSEWTKLRTTSSFWWTSVLAFVFSIGSTILMAALDDPAFPTYGGAMAIAGFTTFGLMTLIIQSVMMVTTEYRFKVNSTNFALTPNRWQVALSKLLVYGLYAAVFSFVTILVCFIVGDLIAANPIEWTDNPFVTRSLWAIPLSTFLAVMFAQGIGWIVRATAGAIAIYLGWQLVLEPSLALIPRIGRDIQTYAPFTNLTSFMQNFQNPGVEPGVSEPLSLWASFGLFAVWAVVLYIIGVMLLERRDT
ncbi:ABC transporter permease [Corynebacterium sp. P3-F1]|uniref:ABC transporter permease n=1 Tax=Corynebacterium sp. P3-F1 TaxID=3059080 RepID=UPI00265CFC4E|nr:ABC transporter permease [Corynebacterium sp. P3-F1]WKK62185.1 ABC transporter permease [Corynebacterium sp. P3-F1]